MSGNFDRLVALFHETGQAHHAAYAETDGDDPDWPIWYAGYLVDRLPDVLNNEITRSELVFDLVLLSRQQSQMADQTKWPEYYARYFIENYQLP